MATLDDEIAEWSAIKEHMRELEAREKLLRDSIFFAAFPDFDEGTQTKNLGNGWRLRGVCRVNRVLDQGVYYSMADDPAVATLVDQKPALRQSAWKALPEKERVRLAALVTERAGMPALELLAPQEDA